MYTREMVFHDFNPGYPPPVNTKGAIAWRPIGKKPGKDTAIYAAIPVARPNSSPAVVQGAPFYSSANYDYVTGMVFRGPSAALKLPQGNVEMDPSDVTTWQRQYRFT